MKPRLLLFALSAGCFAQNLPAPGPDSLAPGNVALPLDEYNQLMDRAEQAQKPVPEPPVPFVLKSAEIHFDVNGELASGTVSIDGEVLSSRDRMVPLVKGMVVRAARRQNAQAQPAEPLAVTQEAGAFSALLGGGSPFSVALEASVPLTIEPGRASFNLRAPQASAVEATLSFPGEETQVSLAPGLITNRSSAGGRTVIEATLEPGTIANVWWASRLSIAPAPAAPKPVRFLSDVKTLISVGQPELSMAALAEITVVEGEPSHFTVRAPQGYELSAATGPTLASSETRQGEIVLNVTNATLRTHHFLISFVRSNASTSAEAPLITFEGAQRETGEVLVEGEGAMELTAREGGSGQEQSSLRRMDLKETNAYLRSMARATLHTAFRYQKKPDEVLSLGLEWTRFPDSKLLAAAAQEATVTTLVTVEGRSLTEVKLTVRNQSQPFLKVDLPAGASILSAEVAGEKVKPVEGPDGDRVPLLRPGFRPTGAYTVSFVFLHAGAPFAKKGGADLALPKMDVPIAHLSWEVFLPQQYRVANFGGDVLPERLLPVMAGNRFREESVPNSYDTLSVVAADQSEFGPGDIVGTVTDAAGAAVAHAQIVVQSLATGAFFLAATDGSGRYRISNVPPGRFKLSCTSPGFKGYVRMASKFDTTSVIRDDITLQVGSASESVTVTAEAPLLNTESAQMSTTFVQGMDQLPLQTEPKPPPVPPQPPSSNVTDLQRRVTGVLPIAINVPRAGNSYRFARALAVDEETMLTFRYKASR